MPDPELPAAREITRTALATESFDVEVFLNEHSQFQTLRDTYVAIKSWEDKLHGELMDVVNANYDEMLDTTASLDRGNKQLNSIREDVQKFENAAHQTERELCEFAREIRKEHETRAQYVKQEAEARKLLRMIDLCDDVDALLPRLNAEQDQDIRTAELEMVSRAIVSLSLLAGQFSTYNAVETIRNRAAVSRKILLKELSASLVQLTSDDSKLKLLHARAFVLENAFPNHSSSGQPL